MEETKRGGMLTFFAVAFALLAIEDLLKPFGLEGPDTGFVFFGTRLQGSSAVVGVMFSVFLLMYALGIWRMRRYALPMAYAYAAYVVLNLVLFTVKGPPPKTQGEMVFGIVFSIVAIAGSWTAAVLLTRRRGQLA
jgi:hypothetical protein